MTATNPMQRYAEQVAYVAQDMLAEPDNTPVTFGGGMPGSLSLFRWAGRHAHLQTVRRLGDTVPPIIKNVNVLSGMLVISRFVYMSGTKARQLNMGAGEYYDALTHPATFAQTLGAVAMYDNRINRGLEESYGLVHGSDPKAAREHYVFVGDGSIELTDMDELAERYRQALVASGKVIREDAMCAAHRAGYLEPIYDALAPMYATHPMLGGAIFTESTPVTQLPAAFAASPRK